MLTKKFTKHGHMTWVMWYKNVDAIWLEELNLSVCVLPFGVFRKMEGQLESSFSRTNTEQ